MNFETDLLDMAEHDEWSKRDNLPRDPAYKDQILRIYAQHLPDGHADYCCTQFRVDGKGALLLTDRGGLVTAFAVGQWQSFESCEIVDDDPTE